MINENTFRKFTFEKNTIRSYKYDYLNHKFIPDEWIIFILLSDFYIYVLFVINTFEIIYSQEIWLIKMDS